MPRASRLRSEQPPADLAVVLVGSAAVAAEADRLAGLLAGRGHRVRRMVQDAADRPAPPTDGPLDDADLVIVLGGDGSILRAARWMGYTQVPALGINLGRLGFLADTRREQAAAALAEVEAGRFRLVDHMMLECEVVRGGSVVHRELGLNEVSLLAGPPFTMIEIDLVVDGEPATTYRADGLIVSTPVGSTAYNLSAGGPIVRKDMDAFVFTPLNPHTLTNRTVVDSAARRYELRVPQPNAGSACLVDGRVVAELAPGDAIRVRRAEPRFTLVEIGGHGYYRTLREKLAWGGGLRAAERSRPEGGA
ncbi:MAG: NAD(+)/NADH kinase [Planctomycetota bacterium]